MDKPIKDFDRIVRPVENQLLQLVWRILGDAHDAEDALQDGMAIVLKRWKRVVSHRNPPALVLKICADCAYDHLRKKMRRSRHKKSVGMLEQVDRTAGPESEMMRREMRQEILRAIAKLSKNQATAFFLRFVEDHSYESIAETLGCGVVTARKHVARARARLSIFLHDLAPSKGPTNDR